VRAGAHKQHCWSSAPQKTRSILPRQAWDK
jgi:hypothetical protein